MRKNACSQTPSPLSEYNSPWWLYCSSSDQLGAGGVSQMRPKTTKNEENKAVEEERRCVNCGRGIKTLFVQYSPGNIRLMKCENCKAVADPYIECEFMIILIDLILHKTKAYRHLLFNMLNLDDGDMKGVFLKSSFVYFLLDACRISLISNSRDDWDSSGSLLVSIWTCGKVLMDVLLGNFIFISVIVLGTRFLLNLSLDIARCKEIMLAILISSYFKLFLIAMMVWEFPSSVLFIIDIFVLSSNAVALRVVTELQTAGCLAVCFGAHAAKLFMDRWLLHLLSGATVRKMLLT